VIVGIFYKVNYMLWLWVFFTR